MPSRGQSEPQESDHSPSGKPSQAKGGPGTGEPQTEEWLAVTRGAEASRKQSAPPRPARRDVDLRDSTSIGKELSEIRARLTEMEATQIEHARLLREATGRARQAEELAAQAERKIREAIEKLGLERTDRASSAAIRTKPEAKTDDPAPVKGSSSINSVDWDELRELGLSVTHSARLLANREVRGGFDSLDELDELHDFPAEAVELLKVRFRA
jgi:DNA uptake protein ComE-like DNA-binding protein